MLLLLKLFLFLTKRLLFIKGMTLILIALLYRVYILPLELLEMLLICIAVGFVRARRDFKVDLKE